MESREKVSIKDYVKQFDQFTKKDQLKIADLISKRTFEKRWMELDAFLPDSELSDDEIVTEVKTARNA